jgi:hypothetical protein
MRKLLLAGAALLGSPRPRPARPSLPTLGSIRLRRQVHSTTPLAAGRSTTKLPSNWLAVRSS